MMAKIKFIQINMVFYILAGLCLTPVRADGESKRDVPAVRSGSGQNHGDFERAARSAERTQRGPLIRAGSWALETWDRSKRAAGNMAHRARNRWHDSAGGFYGSEQSDARGRERVMSNLRNMDIVGERDQLMRHPGGADMRILREMYKEVPVTLRIHYGSSELEERSMDEAADNFWESFLRSGDNYGGYALHRAVQGNTDYSESASELGNYGMDTILSDIRGGAERLGRDVMDVSRVAAAYASGGATEKIISAVELGQDIYNNPERMVELAREHVEKAIRERVIGELDSVMADSMGRRQWENLKQKYGKSRDGLQSIINTLDKAAEVSGDRQLGALAEELKGLRGAMVDKAIAEAQRKLDRQPILPPEIEATPVEDEDKPEQAVEPEVGEEPQPEEDDPPLHRRVGDLSDEEKMALLHCLCRASLGAAIGVQTGYDLRVPEWADPEIHSCGSLANGPCMASGLGCWRSFIDFSTEEARRCLAGFGLDPDNRDVIDVLDEYNREHEEDLQVILHVEPREVCPGDTVRVSVQASGGRGNYRYSYSASDYFLQQDIPERVSRQSSFTLTVDPDRSYKTELVGIRWVTTRPPQAFNMYIQASVDSPTFSGRHNARGRSDREGNMRVVQVAGDIVSIRMRSHADCAAERMPPEEPEDAPPEVPARPPTAPPADPPPDPPPAPPRPPATRPPTDPASPPTAPPTPPSRPPRRPPVGRDDPAPPSEPGEPEPSAPPAEPDVPRTPDTPPEPEPDTPAEPDTKPPADGEPAATVMEGDCGECLIIGGGAESSMVIVTDSSGQSRPEMKRSRRYSVEGCPGQTVRLTVVGTDGFSETAEGTDVEVVISRPLGEESGEDEITAENLSIPDCVLNWTQEFGPPSAEAGAEDLRDAEAAPAVGRQDAPAAETPAMDIFGDGRAADRRRQREGAAMTAQQQSDMTRGARAGDQQLRVAAHTRSAGGREAQTIISDTARQSAQVQRDQSWGTVLGDSVADGVQTGMETFAGTIGSEAADQISRDIFGPTREEREAARQPASSKPAASPPQVAAGSPAASATHKPAPAGKSTPADEPAPGPAAEPEPEKPAPGLDCDLCDSTTAGQVAMADGSRRPMCATCKNRWTCSECNQVTLSMGGASYTAYDENGAVVWRGSIEACTDCSDAWYAEQEARWGNR